jgi:hypothetical protein
MSINMSKSTKILIISIFTFLGISALAAGSLPFSFKAGDPIKADEVNANFQALNDGKQNTITNSPCSDGQFVTGVDGNGKLSCGIDQIGSAGSSGVSSLNGKTGSLAIEGGDGVTVETSEDGKVMISSSASGGLEPQATLTFPFSKTINNINPAFAITNNGGIALSGSSPNGAGVYAFSSNNGNGVSAYSEKNYGVLAFTNTGLAGVYGEGKINGGTGMRGVNNAGPGSSGVWGESALGSGVRGSTTSGTGVLGNSNTGYGVRGVVSQAGTGVYGENSSTTTAGAGIQGRANYVNSVGVNGLSNNGTGVSGSSNTKKGVVGTILSTSAGATSVAVEGVNNGAGYGVRGKGAVGVYGETANPNGSGVEGFTTSGTNSAGVYGHSDTGGVGVWGRNRSQGGVAMRADGNAMQELSFGGWAKAMVVVNDNGTIARCYNGVTGVSSGGCGFSSSRTAQGRYTINFGFDVSTRFYSTDGLPTNGGGTLHALITGISGPTLSIGLIQDGGPDDFSSAEDGNFSLIVF